MTTRQKWMLIGLGLFIAALLVTGLATASGRVCDLAWRTGPKVQLPATYTPSPLPAFEQDVPSPTAVSTRPATPDSREMPTLADFWAGTAGFVIDVRDTGLPMGESDSLVMPNGEVWSYVHASRRSAGIIDRCGDEVDFPGCVVIYRSRDGGYTFSLDQPSTCLFACQACPCVSEVDHVDQQQYPRVFRAENVFYMVYEYRARTMLRRSADGLAWSQPQELPYTGIWTVAIRDCPEGEAIGSHPFNGGDFDCLAGGPPGLFVDGRWLYVFVGLGQNPAGLGCYYGRADGPADQMRKCRHNPLFVGAAEYGPDEKGPQTNPFFDFRTISSADVLRVGKRYYVLYEGIRGPGRDDPGDTQFGLGLARSVGGRIDGRWEEYPGNPILIDLPGNIGLGHADLVQIEGWTVLYTSLDGITRSRLRLIWK